MRRRHESSQRCTRAAVVAISSDFQKRRREHNIVRCHCILQYQHDKKPPEPGMEDVSIFNHDYGEDGGHGELHKHVITKG